MEPRGKKPHLFLNIYDTNRSTSNVFKLLIMFVTFMLKLWVFLPMNVARSRMVSNVH